MSLLEINKRYTQLAEDTCCLSCGGAIDYSKPQPNEFCLDLGSGRGTDVLKMAEEVGNGGFAYGLDIAEGMLAKAKKTAMKLGVDNVRFIHSELENIPLDDEHLDLVISNCTINHASGKQAVWKEIYRVLKRGGRFVVSDIYSISPVPEKYSTDPQAISECWAGAVTKDEYLTHLNTAGFKDVIFIEESIPYRKGEIEVASITIQGIKPNGCCN